MLTSLQDRYPESDYWAKYDPLEVAGDLAAQFGDDERMVGSFRFADPRTKLPLIDRFELRRHGLTARTLVVEQAFVPSLQQPDVARPIRPYSESYSAHSFRGTYLLLRGEIAIVTSQSFSYPKWSSTPEAPRYACPPDQPIRHAEQSMFDQTMMAAGNGVMDLSVRPVTASAAFTPR